MGYEFNKMNFVMMHNETVFQVASKCNLPSALNMMKINKVVMKQKAQSEEQQNMIFQIVNLHPHTQFQFCQMFVTPPKKKSKSKSKNKESSVEMVTASTQTPKEVISVNIAADEEEFSMFNLQVMRQKYLISTIREQDFQD